MLAGNYNFGLQAGLHATPQGCEACFITVLLVENLLGERGAARPQSAKAARWQERRERVCVVVCLCVL